MNLTNEGMLDRMLIDLLLFKNAYREYKAKDQLYVWKLWLRS